GPLPPLPARHRRGRSPDRTSAGAARPSGPLPRRPAPRPAPAPRRQSPPARPDQHEGPVRRPPGAPPGRPARPGRSPRTRRPGPRVASTRATPAPARRRRRLSRHHSPHHLVRIALVERPDVGDDLPRLFVRQHREGGHPVGPPVPDRLEDLGVLTAVTPFGIDQARPHPAAPHRAVTPVTVPLHVELAPRLDRLGLAGERILRLRRRLARRFLLFTALLLRRSRARRDAEPNDGDDNRRPSHTPHDLRSPSVVTDEVRAFPTPTSGTPYDSRISRISACLRTRIASSSSLNASSSRRTPIEMSYTKGRNGSSMLGETGTSSSGTDSCFAK